MITPAQQAAYTKLKSQTKTFWSILESTSTDMLCQSPPAGKWTLGQILEHMAGVDSRAVSYLETKNYQEIRNKGKIRNVVNSFLLNLMLKSPLKFKAPTIEGIQPSAKPIAENILLHWQTSYINLDKYIKGFPAEAANRLVFRHPLAGALNLEQTLKFMYNHQAHHISQIKAIIDN